MVSTHLSATHLAVDALRILAEPWRVQEEKRKKKDEVVQQALGARIRQLREKKGWSQEDFAARSGLHRTFVGNIERGLKNTTILTLVMVSKALGITVSELLRGLEKRVEELRK
jgi:ribosome-binding protein aMBF1 (putative translation factor)